MPCETSFLQLHREMIPVKSPHAAAQDTLEERVQVIHDTDQQCITTGTVNQLCKSACIKNSLLNGKCLMKWGASAFDRQSFEEHLLDESGSHAGDTKSETA